MIHVGDCLDVLRTLPAESVDCCVTSPPYWGLRDYGTATWEGGDPECDHVEIAAGRGERNTLGPNGHLPLTNSAFVGRIRQYAVTCGKCGARRIDAQIGLEPTPDAWCARLVEVFREVRRVLKDSGTLWLNVGDSWASGKGTCYNPGGGARSLGQERKAAGVHPLDRGNKSTLAASGLKPKDLIGLPWLLAFALRADGWWLRSDIIWVKNSCMPESVRDRPTSSHEHVFLLTKQARYFYDAEAVREPHKLDGRRQTTVSVGENSHKNYAGSNGHERWPNGGRNLRNVWTINSQPLREAHFAAYPEALVRRCILAGTSAKGVCQDCGKPWERVVERGFTAHDGDTESAYPTGTTANRLATLRQAARENGGEYVNNTRTLGWRPTCACGADVEPATVLDPFTGSGTTGLVAVKLGRRFVGIDLNPAYVAMAERRIAAAAAQEVMAL